MAPPGSLSLGCLLLFSALSRCSCEAPGLTGERSSERRTTGCQASGSGRMLFAGVVKSYRLCVLHVHVKTAGLQISRNVRLVEREYNAVNKAELRCIMLNSRLCFASGGRGAHTYHDFAKLGEAQPTHLQVSQIQVHKPAQVSGSAAMIYNMCLHYVCGICTNLAHNSIGIAYLALQACTVMTI